MSQQRIVFNSRLENGYQILSNFAPTPFAYEHDGRLIVYPTAEHFYQYWKTADEKWRARILAAETGAEAKQISKHVPVRPRWDRLKLRVMRQALKLKFTQNPKAYELLVSTGDAELVHYCPWENKSFWGVGRSGGENWMGFLLMETRRELGYLPNWSSNK